MMDSPVIVDTATEFGRGVDPRSLPGFPFDDVEGFGRRDIRSHLDDLAARHPEFADHLLGSAWGDIPAFQNTGSLRNRRRRGSGGSYQGHPDEDARSQTSGTSAASGASGVSSHEDNQEYPRSSNFHEKTNPKDENSQNRVKSPMSQYGLRNTVDIGQHNHNMENAERSNENRGQRSMSAPPENRQQKNDSSNSQQQQEQNPPNTNQRFVSRVDITPQFHQQPDPPSTEKTSTKPQPSQNQAKSQPSNVRHIPIFVEGRDEPVIPKEPETDSESSSAWSRQTGKPQRSSTPPQQQPHYQQGPQFTGNSQFHQSPQFSSPPKFHRPSHFNHHFAGSRARDWLPNFEEEFYDPPTSGFHSGIRKPSAHSPPRHQSFFRQGDQNDRPRMNTENFPFHQQQQHPQQQQPQQQQKFQSQAQPQPQQPEVPVERKQTQPKDPMEKVAEVQKEIDSLNEQVNQWKGQSKKDKQYIYLDEMLTRELIKLDDIETEGKENVRQARKNAIKCIQDSISLLESKVEQPQNSGMTMETATTTTAMPEKSASPPLENMENTDIVAENVQPMEQTAIPLPAAPSTPAKESVPQSPEAQEAIVQTIIPLPDVSNRISVEAKDSSTSQDNAFRNDTDIAMTTAEPAVQVQNNQDCKSTPEIADQTVPDAPIEDDHPKNAKKLRKTKKQKPQIQAPISEGAIPLPAPESHETPCSSR